MGYYHGHCARLHLSANARPETRAFLKAFVEGTIERDEYHNCRVPGHLAIEEEDGQERDWDRLRMEGAAYLHWNTRKFEEQPDGSAIIILSGSGKHNTADYFLPFLQVLQPDLVLTAGQILMHVVGEDSGHGQMIAVKQTDNGLELEKANGLLYVSDHNFVIDDRHPECKSADVTDLVWTVEELMVWNLDTEARITEKQAAENMGYWTGSLPEESTERTPRDLEEKVDGAPEKIDEVPERHFVKDLFGKLVPGALTGSKSTLATSLMLSRIHHSTLLERPVEEIVKGKKGYALPMRYLKRCFMTSTKSSDTKPPVNKLNRRLWTWQPGRQRDCDYQKKLLWEFGSHFLNKFTDGYLIKYPANAQLPKHTDPVKNGTHWRINITLKGQGEFGIEGPVKRFGRVVIFRPDVNSHWMNNGPTERLILSIGFVF